MNMIGEVAGADGEEQSQQRRRQRAQHRRSRTGCERCRARRRKCTEEKPRCRSCVDADAECRYVTRLSFLDKNSQTLTQSAIPGTTEPGTSGYPALQFVVDGPSAEQSTTPSSPSITLAQHNDQSQDQPAPTVSTEEFGSANIINELQRRNSEILHSNHGGVGDLGTARDTATTDEPHVSGSEHLNITDMVPSLEPPFAELPTTLDSLTFSQIGLLQTYSRHVAPWLDVLDLRQTFTLLVPRLAMLSPLVLVSFLRLAAVSSGHSLEDAGQSTNGLFNLSTTVSKPGQVRYFDALQHMAVHVLLKAQLFITSVPDTWQHVFVPGVQVPIFPNYNFGNVCHQSIWFAGIVLMSRMVPAVSSELLYDTLVAKPDYLRQSLDASIRGLALLADVMHLCLQPEDQDATAARVQARSDGSSVDRWKHLLHELQGWHISRPPELQELAKLETSDALFPTVIFTSGAGVSANMTYHVTMFLLVKNRPRKEAMGAVQSPLWHARRVCGIALSSEPQHTRCWDPCMIAAFTVAARCMTGPSQQAELLAFLQRIKASGWRIDNLAQSLRDEW